MDLIYYSNVSPLPAFDKATFILHDLPLPLTLVLIPHTLQSKCPTRLTIFIHSNATWRNVGLIAMHAT